MNIATLNQEQLNMLLDHYEKMRPEHKCKLSLQIFLFIAHSGLFLHQLKGAHFNGICHGTICFREDRNHKIICVELNHVAINLLGAGSKKSNGFKSVPGSSVSLYRMKQSLINSKCFETLTERKINEDLHDITNLLGMRLRLTLLSARKTFKILYKSTYAFGQLLVEYTQQ